MQCQCETPIWFQEIKITQIKVQNNPNKPKEHQFSFIKYKKNFRKQKIHKICNSSVKQEEQLTIREEK